MLTLSLTFPAGRYHGTPWGRHVNEADVAWPPDLWRLSRAFIANWHRKIDPVRHPQARLASLLAALVSEAPHYQLPDAVHFHTRHYMPVRDKPSLIFDAFAQVGREAEMFIHWPTLVLDADRTALLDDLLFGLGYLGRAESWIEARRVTAWQGPCNCLPDDCPSTDLEPATDLIPLLRPLSPADYAAVREAQLAAALARAEAERLVKQAEAIAAGKPPAKSTKAKPPGDIVATLPEDWLSAISLDTGELQKAGWSAPPAARAVTYRRPKDALRFMAAAHPIRSVGSEASPTTARFALYAKPLPLLTDSVRVGETLRAAIMGRARRLFGDDLPTVLSGHDLPADNRHGHAFFLAEDSDGDGRVDHLILHAPDGFDQRAQQALAELSHIRAKDEQEWQILLEGLGMAGDFPPSTLLGKSAGWETVTPYLHPWFRKKNFGIPEQLRRECQLRGLAQPIAIEVLPDERAPRILDFRRFRNKRGLVQPDRHGSRLRLVFAEPVEGPLALGFGCHFGLGVFGRMPDALP